MRAAGCAECGGPVVQTGRGRPRRFCSDRCRSRFSNRRSRRRRKPLRDPNPPPKPCAHCGKLFVPINRNRIYCYGWCAQAAYQKRKRGGAPPRMVKRIATCDECGGEFAAEHPNARWCSTKCHRRFWGKVQSRQRFSLSAASYSDLDIFDRDGWRCHLCSEPVDPALGRTHPMGATIDHIVPLSLDGTDTSDNVALAHRSCNRRKSADLT